MRPARGARIAAAGSAIPVAFAIALLVGVMLMLSSERLLGVSRLQADGAQRQRARYAAEAVTALRESELVGFAAEGDPAVLDRSPDPNCGVDWIGGCLVRWRVEPARVGDATRWTVNPRADGSTPSASGYQDNQRLFTYRIAAEAYLPSDPQSPLLAAFSLDYASSDPRAPWNTPTERLCRVQVERETTLLREPLVGTARGGTMPRWQLFYGGNGPAGDIELFDAAPAIPLRIQGAVYANGALYLGGTPNGMLYHGAAVSGRDTAIGDAARPVQVVAMDGVYRLRKSAALSYAYAESPSLGRYPRDVPLPNVGAMVLGNDLNGDAASTQHTINGVVVTPANDSRSRPQKQAAFGLQVVDEEDASTARIATSFRSLPLEPQRLVGPGVPLLDGDGVFAFGNPATWDLTIHPSETSLPLYYDSDPASTATPTVGTAVTPYPVYATEMPLFWRGGRADVWPDDKPIPLSQRDAAGFPAPGGPLLGDGALYHHWYAQARWGDDDLPATPDPTGICIRERPVALDGQAAWPAFAGDQAAYAAAAVHYLASNYFVTWNYSDVTDDFFGFGLADAQAAPLRDLRALCAYEAFFCDRRETAWLCASGTPANVGMGFPWDWHFLDNPTVAGSPAAQFQTSAFTLQLGRVKAYLAAHGASSANFNGKIYAARTYRIAGPGGAHNPLRPYGYHPVSDPRCTARDLDPRQNAAPLLWWRGTTERPGCQSTVLPLSWKAVRIADADDIDTGIDSPATGRPLGLAVITPNTCYIRGDVNQAGARPTPMAVLCDGAIVQSTAWSDGAPHQAFSTVGLSPAGSTSWRLSLVTNNIPTQVLPGGYVRDSLGVVGLIRTLENWGGVPTRVFSLTGQIVVPGRQRYSDSPSSRTGASTASSGGEWNLYADSQLTANGAVPPVEVVGASVASSIATVHFVE